jgi:TetR/AcrR family transcriptional regulator, ethionamide resistance regulator
VSIEPLSVNARTGMRRRAATQQDLLDATVRLLQRGMSLSALSIDKIVAEAGVARSTFYLHFKDKRQLIENLAEEQMAWIERIGQGAFRDPELTLSTVQEAVDEIVARWVANHAVLSAIIELAEYDAATRQTWVGIISHVAGVASGVFRAHWDKTGAAPAYPDRVAEALTWMIERTCHQLADDVAARDEISNSLAEIIWRTVHSPGSSGDRPGG